MKRFICFPLLVVTLYLLSSCTGQTEHTFQSYVGVFEDEQGVLYELKADSTTLLTFPDSITYEGTWSMNTSEDGKWSYINIEFGGNLKYYYVMNGKIYRSERELRHDAFGSKLKKVNK